MHGDEASVGWVSRTFDGALQQSEAVGIGFWQIVMIYAVLVSDVSVPRPLLLGAHLAILVVACVILVRRLRAWPLLPLVYAALLLDYRAVADPDSAMAFLCFWTSLVFAGMPFLLLRARHAVWFVVLALVSTLGGLLAWHGSLGVGEVVITALSAVALAVAAMTMIETVRALARGVDAQQAVAVRERERLVLRRTVARAAAEDARVMHDTLINTLSLLASGTRVIAANRSEVRERCARDTEVVDAILGGQRLNGSQGFRPSDITVPRGLELYRTGLDDDELDGYVARLPEPVAGAAQGAVQELVRNAAKHSGSDRVTLDIRGRDDALIAHVSDAGRGFDGRPIAGRGLAESVVARARDVGIEVAIRTAPGAGTAVTLTIPLDGAETAPGEAADDSAAARRTVERIRRTTCWRWAMVVVGFGVVDVAIRQPPAAIAACAMLAVVAMLSWLAAWACRDGRMLPPWATVVLLAAIPATFLLGLASIGFGRSDVKDWPTIVMTALPVILLVNRRSRTAFFLGVALLVLTAGVTTYVVWLGAAGHAAVIPAGVATQFAVLAGWLVLDYEIVTIGIRHERTLRELADDRLERGARERIGIARARWTAAGAHRSVALLRRIAGGEIDPAERAVQRECGEAERYLRQVLLLNSETVHMSPWIGRALSEARSKRVSLALRSGAADTPTEDLAAAFGRTILAGIDALAPGSRLDVGLFPGANGPQLLLVGPHASLCDIVAPADLPAGYALTYRQYDDQDLLEVAAAALAERSPSPGTARAPVSDR